MLKNRNLNVRVTPKTLEQLDTICTLLGDPFGRPLSKSVAVERAIYMMEYLVLTYWGDGLTFDENGNVTSGYHEILDMLFGHRFRVHDPNDVYSFRGVSLKKENDKIEDNNN